MVHGGGWLVGDLDLTEADWVARELCTRSGATIVSVDYRKAVDGLTYPAPLNDVVNALRWVRQHTRSGPARPDCP